MSVVARFGKAGLICVELVNGALRLPRSGMRQAVLSYHYVPMLRKAVEGGKQRHKF